MLYKGERDYRLGRSRIRVHSPRFLGKTRGRGSTLSPQPAHLLYCVAHLTLEASKVSDDTVEVNQEAVNQDYEAAYSEEAFWKKIAAAAIRAGKKILLMVLTLYYCLQDPDTPPKAKTIIVAALGYFICAVRRHYRLRARWLRGRSWGTGDGIRHRTHSYKRGASAACEREARGVAGGRRLRSKPRTLLPSGQ